MVHQGEMWQLYYGNGESIEGAGWDSERGNPKEKDSEIVGIATVFLFRKVADGGLEVLWQKRADNVDRYPGEWDISAGGHINLGETIVEGAIREVREEIGATITRDDLYLVTEQSHNKNRIAWVFAVDYTGREEDFKFSDGEVSELRWIPYEEMKEFIKKYAKKPLKKDKLTFKNLDYWFEIHGYL